MISVKLMGGLCNNLFQISAALGHSLKYNNTPCHIPTIIDNPHSEGQKVFYSPHLNYCDIETEISIYFEPSFSYNEIPNTPDIYLQGYFQSYLYHHQFKNEILRLLNIEHKFNEGFVFLHYRLGDYKKLGLFHQIISDDYIRKAIHYFIGVGYNKFLVFSDEIEEAKNIINKDKFEGWASFYYSEGKSELEDLSLMAGCEHGIMSASAFSWWAAYIGQNEDRRILYPHKWFGEELNHHSIKDLCPPNWIAL